MPSLLIPICFYGLVEFAGLAAPVVGLVLTAGFKFCAAFWSRFPGAGGCVCFCFTSTESLILAQDERWRR
ncbi:hypothetical protein, partial [Arthrobacter sp. RT-1]|uniref:hypothetical protein n=1 Tax=Arthrobacter sp. RT-1 TaxID=2292263 RepID=UPI001C69CD84